MLLNFLLTLLIIVGVALTGLVLLQRSEGGALGMGGGGGGQLISARGASNFLTKTTWILGAVFIVLSLAITMLLTNQAGTGSITDRMKIEGVDPATLAAQAKAQAEAAKQRSGPMLPAPGPVSPITPPAGSSAPVLPSPFSTAPAAAPKQAAPKAAAPAPGPTAPPALTLPTIPTTPAEQ